MLRYGLSVWLTEVFRPVYVAATLPNERPSTGIWFS
jgi:hypothetical protein